MKINPGRVFKVLRPPNPYAPPSPVRLTPEQAATATVPLPDRASVGGHLPKSAIARPPRPGEDKEAGTTKVGTSFAAKAARKLERSDRKAGDITVTKRLRTSATGMEILGTTFGRYWCHSPEDGSLLGLPIKSIGVHVWYGEPVLFGVVRGLTDVFIARAGQIFKLAGVVLDKPALDLARVPPEDALDFSRAVVAQARRLEKLTTGEQDRRDVFEWAVNNYQRAVRYQINNALIVAEQVGRPLTVRDLAEMVSPNWTVAELVSPAYPTLKHALIVATLLALPTHRAAKLLSRAAVLEIGSDLLPENTDPTDGSRIAIDAWSHHAMAMERLYPTWLQLGVRLNWKHMGGVLKVLDNLRIQNLSAWVERAKPREKNNE